MDAGDFYLGGIVDGAGERTADLLAYDPSDLTTHGVIVGMTGSGKTGLGIIFLEEALLNGIPTIVLDPKGDMTNLLLTFPELRPKDFEPWVDPAAAQKEGKSVTELAADTAELWRRGLESWDQDGARISSLRDAASFVIYTPGSAAGVPINIVGSLAAPENWDDVAETARDEIESFVTGLLRLAGIDADPISSREHILLANIIEHAWSGGHDLDLASLLGAIQQPPIRKLGVFEIDSFFPEKDRLELAMRLNGLIASPSFASWLEGPPLDVGSLLWDESGRPQASILYLAHLSDEERQFIVTLVLSQVVTWMRSQTGTGDLRALVYMDEVFGFVPPTAAPPAKKPILTLLKQARAFGVGLLLSTQNPVDLDYKAMSNAGTWCVGRLQTERDKARILEALQSARGDGDVSALDRAISGLGKRQFLLHSTRDDVPSLFTTRWAMSYLRGPLTRTQISNLMSGHDAPPTPTRTETAREPAAAADETPVMPAVATAVPVYHLDPAAPWADAVGAVPGGTRLEPALAARVHLLYDDAPSKTQHTETWEAVYYPLGTRFDPAAAITVDHDERDFRNEPPREARYIIGEAPLGEASWFKAAAADIKDHLYRSRRVEIFKNPALKLYSRVGETHDEFAARCGEAADNEADKRIAAIRDRFETRMDRVRDQLEAAYRRMEELEVDVTTRRRDEVLSGAGDLLGALLRGRRSTRTLGRASSKRSQTRRTEQRLESARAKVTDKADDLDELEAELAEEVIEINEEWHAKAGEIERVEIPLEKTDIDVDLVSLVWVPTAG